MSYVHLTISERVNIETLTDLNYSIREIAHKLGRSPSTISREMKRCERDVPYQAESAQETYAGKKKVLRREVQRNRRNGGHCPAEA